MREIIELDDYHQSQIPDPKPDFRKLEPKTLNPI